MFIPSLKPKASASVTSPPSNGSWARNLVAWAQGGEMPVEIPEKENSGFNGQIIESRIAHETWSWATRWSTR